MPAATAPLSISNADPSTRVKGAQFAANMTSKLMANVIHKHHGTETRTIAEWSALLDDKNNSVPVRPVGKRVVRVKTR